MKSEKKRDENGRWLPGTSGNPGGRQKDVAGAIIREILESDEGLESQRKLIKETLDEAVEKKDYDTIVKMVERAYGKPAATINHQGNPVQINLDNSQGKKLKNIESKLNG